MPQDRFLRPQAYAKQRRLFVRLLGFSLQLLFFVHGPDLPLLRVRGARPAPSAAATARGLQYVQGWLVGPVARP